MIFRLTNLADCVLEELAQLIAHQSPGRTQQAVDVAQLNRALANPHFYLFIKKVALPNGDIRYAGMASVFLQFNVVRTIAEVHDVVTHPEFRGQGIARALMEELHGTVRKYAQQCGQPIKLYLTSRPSRVEANRLYQKLGYTLVASAEGEWGTNLYKMVITP